jgi:hypothetical protein
MTDPHIKIISTFSKFIEKHNQISSDRKEEQKELLTSIGIQVAENISRIQQSSKSDDTEQYRTVTQKPTPIYIDSISDESIKKISTMMANLLPSTSGGVDVNQTEKELLSDEKLPTLGFAFPDLPILGALPSPSILNLSALFELFMSLIDLATSTRKPPKGPKKPKGPPKKPMTPAEKAKVRYNRAQQKAKQLKVQLDKANARQARLNQSLESAQGDLAKSKSLSADLSKRIQTLNNEAKNLNQQIDNPKTQGEALKKAKARLSALRTELDQVTKTSNTANQRIKALQGTVSNATAQVQTNKTVSKTTNAKINQLNKTAPPPKPVVRAPIPPTVSKGHSGTKSIGQVLGQTLQKVPGAKMVSKVTTVVKNSTTFKFMGGTARVAGKGLIALDIAMSLYGAYDDATMKTDLRANAGKDGPFGLTQTQIDKHFNDMHNAGYKRAYDPQALHKNKNSKGEKVRFLNTAAFKGSPLSKEFYTNFMSEMNTDAGILGQTGTILLAGFKPLDVFSHTRWAANKMETAIYSKAYERRNKNSSRMFAGMQARGVYSDTWDALGVKQDPFNQFHKPGEEKTVDWSSVKDLIAKQYTTDEDQWNIVIDQAGALSVMMGGRGFIDQADEETRKSMTKESAGSADAMSGMQAMQAIMGSDILQNLISSQASHVQSSYIVSQALSLFGGFKADNTGFETKTFAKEEAIDELRQGFAFGNIPWNSGLLTFNNPRLGYFYGGEDGSYRTGSATGMYGGMGRESSGTPEGPFGYSNMLFPGLVQGHPIFGTYIDEKSIESANKEINKVAGSFNFMKTLDDYGKYFNSSNSSETAVTPYQKALSGGSAFKMFMNMGNSPQYNPKALKKIFDPAQKELQALAKTHTPNLLKTAMAYNKMMAIEAYKTLAANPSKKQDPILFQMVHAALASGAMDGSIADKIDSKWIRQKLYGGDPSAGSGIPEYNFIEGLVKKVITSSNKNKPGLNFHEGLVGKDETSVDRNNRATTISSKFDLKISDGPTDEQLHKDLYQYEYGITSSYSKEHEFTAEQLSAFRKQNYHTDLRANELVNELEANLKSRLANESVNLEELAKWYSQELSKLAKKNVVINNSSVTITTSTADKKLKHVTLTGTKVIGEDDTYNSESRARTTISSRVGGDVQTGGYTPPSVKKDDFPFLSTPTAHWAND